ncbi:hypothetical protein NDU88_006502 [Pleurodeles waltl]|uniref:Uncharacterized protein n=1 Tax=Pleurodeles waltl TaxID=8319 RepID=A0AAV7QHT1_PLEWA|nr:hypothetical protein NDU88_006502 [Pleurodeles waltl]
MAQSLPVLGAVQPASACTSQVAAQAATESVVGVVPVGDVSAMAMGASRGGEVGQQDLIGHLALVLLWLFEVDLLPTSLVGGGRWWVLVKEKKNTAGGSRPLNPKDVWLSAREAKVVLGYPWGSGVGACGGMPRRTGIRYLLLKVQVNSYQLEQRPAPLLIGSPEKLLKARKVCLSAEV